MSLHVVSFTPYTDGKYTCHEIKQLLLFFFLSEKKFTVFHFFTIKNIKIIKRYTKNRWHASKPADEAHILNEFVSLNLHSSRIVYWICESACIHTHLKILKNHKLFK